MENRITFRMDEKLARMIQAYSDDTNQSRSEVVRMILERFYNMLDYSVTQEMATASFSMSPVR